MTFWNNINVTENIEECWEYKNQPTKQYPETSHKGRRWAVHRLSWYLINGDIPNGMCVCHKCDNPRCCNPNHLFLGTHQDNVNDREQKGRNKMPHSIGEDHGHAKLTKEQVLEIRNLYSLTDHSYRSLANLFKVSFGEIRKIVKRETWGWLNG